MDELVRFEQVACSYGGAPVLSGIDVTIGAGEFVGVVGPSGSGKTTFLKTLLGTIRPVAGRVHRRDRLRFGYVPQLEAVDWSFPATVHDVIAMNVARPRFRRLGDASVRRIDQLLTDLGLADLGRRHIRELSGGQQQRVFVARALVNDPDVLVLDEPASGVDVATRHEMLHLLADLNRAGLTIVVTTHDINALAAHLPRLVCLSGAVVADGPPDDVLTPDVLERTYGAPMEVLSHGGMPVVLEHRGHGLHERLRGRSA